MTVLEPQFLNALECDCGGVVCVDIWLYNANAPLATFTQLSNIEATFVALDVLYNGTRVSALQLLNIPLKSVTPDVDRDGADASEEHP